MTGSAFCKGKYIFPMAPDCARRNRIVELDLTRLGPPRTFMCLVACKQTAVIIQCLDLYLSWSTSCSILWEQLDRHYSPSSGLVGILFNFVGTAGRIGMLREHHVYLQRPGVSVSIH